MDDVRLADVGSEGIEHRLAELLAKAGDFGDWDFAGIPYRYSDDLTSIPQYFPTLFPRIVQAGQEGHSVPRPHKMPPEIEEKEMPPAHTPKPGWVERIRDEACKRCVMHR